MAGNDTLVPRNLQDFGNGGAYPLGMGMRDSKPDQKVLPVTYNDLVPKILRDEDDDDVETIEEEQKLIEETTLSTKTALEKIVSVRLSAVPKHSSESEFIKYKPSQQATAFKSGAKERTIRMVEMQVDPPEPPKFKHKRVPKASGLPPVPIMHSSTPPVTVKDQRDWRIPPCISNWKNPKGYTFPIDKRLAAADGRGHCIFLSTSLEKLRAKIHKEKAMMEEERKVQELWELAAKARVSLPVTSDAEKRSKIREERHRERRLAKKSKVTRDCDRDVTEKIALGMASAGGGASRGEVIYDQRLFNQDKGIISSGFATDDQYNLYDKALFSAQSTLSILCKPKTDMVSDIYGGAGDQLKKTKSKPDRVFSGPSEEKGCSKRERQVEFETDNADPFDLDQFFTQLMKKAKDTV
ncbi:LOW QUALITY PROTEIN: hypothetical protein V2J09_015229 [Rumex salicifolius]